MGAAAIQEAEKEVYKVIMENNVVKAFRQRLKRGGFTDISIYDQLNGVYVVSFRDKDGKRDRREMTETQMRNTPHLVWFD